MIRNSGTGISPQEHIAGRSEGRQEMHIDHKKNYFLYKRIFDITASIFFIAGILSWLTPIVAILIKLFSRGPVFFSQQRIGRDGRTFTCYKFRTMVVNKDADKRQASYDDERITGIGGILRKLNMDEFPQFFNVLMGDMSLVGPRPHMHSDYNKFSALIAGYTFRNMVRPGITGLAQVKGYTGPAMDIDSIFGRYQWDAFYVRNAGFMLDLRIIRKTISQQFSFAGKLLLSVFIFLR